MTESNLQTEWTALCSELSKLDKVHDDYLHKLEDLTKIQSSALKAIKHHNYLLNNLKESISKAKMAASTDEEKQRIATIEKETVDARSKLKEMQSELPVMNNGFYLSLILGSNLNLSLLSKDERYQYKQDYENFKWRITWTVLVMMFLAYLIPFRAIDSIGNFVMVWYYCTLTIRENVLTINGSKIKGWWVFHHYISCVLCGIVLTWKEGECYRSFRPQFILFVAYICVVQLLQNQYQSGCLRRLHSLGQGHQMDITVEGFTSWMFKGLTFLLPFLVAGYFFQLYNAYTLYLLSYQCPGQWQVGALCFLFLLIALGNIFTTSLVMFKKFKTSGTYISFLNITRKYRMRREKKSE